MKGPAGLRTGGNSLTLIFTANQEANKMSYTCIYYAWPIAVLTIQCITTNIYLLKYYVIFITLATASVPEDLHHEKKSAKSLTTWVDFSMRV